jgi:hypothetical protein
MNVILFNYELIRMFRNKKPRILFGAFKKSKLIIDFKKKI